MFISRQFFSRTFQLSDIVENKLLPALAENHRPLALRASVMDEDE